MGIVQVCSLERGSPAPSQAPARPRQSAALAATGTDSISAPRCPALSGMARPIVPSRHPMAPPHRSRKTAKEGRHMIVAGGGGWGGGRVGWRNSLSIGAKLAGRGVVVGRGRGEGEGLRRRVCLGRRGGAWLAGGGEGWRRARRGAEPSPATLTSRVEPLARDPSQGP